MKSNMFLINCVTNCKASNIEMASNFGFIVAYNMFSVVYEFPPNY